MGTGKTRASRGRDQRLRFFKGAAILAGCLLLVATAAFFWILDLPSMPALNIDKIRSMDQTLRIYDRDDQLAADIYSSENRIVVTLPEISPYAIDAVLAIEDTRFYQHHGVDFVRIAGALWADIKSFSFTQGASTITQQLIKNTHLSSEKSPRRKLQEAVLAWQLENRMDKNEILEIYMNHTYFGGGAYGIEAAARRYFNTSAAELSLAQSALIAGILKGTGIYAPHINLAKSIERRAIVLDAMVDAGFITAAEAAAAKQEAVVLEQGGDRNLDRNSYIDTAISQAAAIVGTDYDTLVNSGYQVYTYMDAELQQYAQQLMQDNTLFPAQTEDGLAVEAALVMADSTTGGVSVLVGGRSYTARGFNRATHGLRQPGSTIKPILVYAPALDRHGYTATTMILDEAVDYSGYQPQNFTGTFNGWVTLREALVKSMNVPAVRVLHNIGIDSAADFAALCGIQLTDQDRNLAIALGGLTEGISPYTLAQAYLPLSNGGYALSATLIRKIVDPSGHVAYTHRADPVRVMQPETSFILSNVLSDVVLIGTGTRLKQVGIPLAAKTGTVSDSQGNLRDAWIAAYNAECVLTVWMGYDRNEEPMPPGATGGNFPAALAARLLAEKYANSAPPSFSRPEGVVKVVVDKKMLVLEQKAYLVTDLTPDPYRLTEYYPTLQAPTLTSPYWVPPLPPIDLTVTLGEDGIDVVFTTRQEFVRYLIERMGPDDTDFRVVETVEGTTAQARFSDTDIAEPGTYQYRVTPLHPEILKDGVPLRGTPTSVRAVTVAEDTAPPPFDWFPWW